MQDWQERYKNKKIDAKDVVHYIQPGARIFIHSGCSEPQALMQQLIKHHKYLKDIEINHFLSIRRDLPLEDKPEDLFRYNAFFIAHDSIRKAVNEGQADYTPMFLSEIPDLFRFRKTIDVALIQVSPPDRNGFCSLGVNVDVAKPIAEAAKLVIAEINPKVPRTVGNSIIPMKKIDRWCFNDTTLLEYKYSKPGKIHKQIAQRVATLIKNGSTIQVGIGRAPNAVLYELDDHKDLGVHTDTIFNKYMDLIDSGVITCERKNYNHGRIIANFALGTNQLFKYLDNNLFIEFHPADYTNNPYNIARNNNMVSINGALQVDITGQVNSSILPSVSSVNSNEPPYIFQGIGGIVDFTRGASMSRGGRSIICLPSTAIINGIKVSRIVPAFSPGTHVSLTMGDVHYIVTEYGIAHLHGKSIRERIMALISIAHPDFRQWLLDEAKKFKFIYSDQQLVISEKTGNVVIYPEKYQYVIKAKKGDKVRFRPIKPTDERMVQELYYSLDDEDRIYRFFTKKKYFNRNDPSVKSMVHIDYETVMTLVGTVGELKNEKIIALCSYEVDEKSNLGEIAFTVHKEWRDQGLTKYMLNLLIRIAKEKELDGFKGEILWENKKMVHIIRNSGYTIESFLEGDDWLFSFRFAEKNKPK